MFIKKHFECFKRASVGNKTTLYGTYTTDNPYRFTRFEFYVRDATADASYMCHSPKFYLLVAEFDFHCGSPLLSLGVLRS